MAPLPLISIVAIRPRRGAEEAILPRAPAGALRALLLCPLLFCLWGSAAAYAQAPTEERRLHGDAYAEAQQRVEAARKASEQSEGELHRLDKEFQDADTDLGAARKQWDEARTRRELAKRRLAEGAKRSAEDKHTLDREERAFEQLRRGAARPSKT